MVNVTYPNRRALFHPTKVCSDDPGTKLAGNIFAEKGESFACSGKIFPCGWKGKEREEKSVPAEPATSRSLSLKRNFFLFASLCFSVPSALPHFKPLMNFHVSVEIWLYHD